MNEFKKYYSDKLTLSVYPPYNKEKDLESYFIDFYFKNLKKSNALERLFLPIKWTAIWNEHRELMPFLEKDLQNCDKQNKYFTVSQHDDAPYFQLPPCTINFSAGGNVTNTIPIPLISGPVPKIETTNKDIFCSFVGSVPQNIGGYASLAYKVRMTMLESLVNKTDYYLKPKMWSPIIQPERQDLFLTITARSKFTLCPRGYGATSFRLYEAMQLQSIPVYIYTDKPFLPYENEIDWNKLCVLLEINNIEQLDKTLKGLSDTIVLDMLKYTKQIYQKYFTLEGTCLQIIKYLESIEKV